MLMSQVLQRVTSQPLLGSAQRGGNSTLKRQNLEYGASGKTKRQGVLAPCHFQGIAHKGACGKALAVPHTSWTCLGTGRDE